ncbi:hypothetical protein F506_20200 [Herbaspirillum hiltneri N3]|uniref:Uncharacterized protein n=1 Tax=Herbaspirillum hiltneri N3 TaxID=1262470 RepID=A0ABM5V4T2_9BURK|nr:hypothetical protein [Herbaspirillum hiltneri]AKZ64667.1 hypothetical protein F506_20200 [Herbaspirillum hiltneri N3]
MEPKALRTKPQAVRKAINLLWASTFGIGLIKTILDYSHWSTLGTPIFRFSVLLITSAVLVLLIFKMSEGKNWARITWLVFFVLGLLPSFLTIKGELSRSLLLGAISIIQILVQIYAGYLLFSKGGGVWFRKLNQSDEQTIGQARLDNSV